MAERQLPTQEQRSAFFGKVPELIEQEVFGQKSIVGLNSLDFTMVIAASKSELVKVEYELKEGEFVQVSLAKAEWDGEAWGEDLFNQNPQG